MAKVIIRIKEENYMILVIEETNCPLNIYILLEFGIIITLKIRRKAIYHTSSFPVNTLNTRAFYEINFFF